jgi:hypothetical protein
VRLVVRHLCCHVLLHALHGGLDQLSALRGRIHQRLQLRGRRRLVAHRSQLVGGER